MRTIAESVLDAIRQADTVALCSHVCPDGDTLGSALAMKLGLEQLGKQATVLCQDPVPETLHILPEWRCVASPEEVGDRHFDLLLSVDASEAGRLGTCCALMARCAHSAQIDHHSTNTAYCEYNEIDAKASATALLVKATLDALGVTLTKDIAICLYVGIATDTGNFAHSNITMEAFRVVSELDLESQTINRLNRALFREKTRAQVMLLERALHSLTFYHGGEITSMKLTLRDFEETGTQPEEAVTLVNYGAEIKGVKLAMLARELPGGRVMLNLRAVEGLNAAEIASSFGGGGHVQAAGCTLHIALDEAVQQMVAAMEAHIDRQWSR